MQSGIARAINILEMSGDIVDRGGSTIVSHFDSLFTGLQRFDSSPRLASFVRSRNLDYGLPTSLILSLLPTKVLYSIKGVTFILDFLASRKYTQAIQSEEPSSTQSLRHICALASRAIALKHIWDTRLGTQTGTMSSVNWREVSFNLGAAESLTGKSLRGFNILTMFIYRFLPINKLTTTMEAVNFHAYTDILLLRIASYFSKTVASNIRILALVGMLRNEQQCLTDTSISLYKKNIELTQQIQQSYADRSETIQPLYDVGDGALWTKLNIEQALAKGGDIPINGIPLKECLRVPVPSLLAKIATLHHEGQWRNEILLDRIDSMLYDMITNTGFRRTADECIALLHYVSLPIIQEYERTNRRNIAKEPAKTFLSILAHTIVFGSKVSYNEEHQTYDILVVYRAFRSCAADRLHDFHMN